MNFYRTGKYSGDCVNIGACNGNDLSYSYDGRLLETRETDFYSYAYSVYTILLLLSSYSLPLAVSKMVSAKAQLGQWRNVKRVFICAIAFAIGIGTTLV